MNKKKRWFAYDYWSMKSLLQLEKMLCWVEVCIQLWEVNERKRSWAQENLPGWIFLWSAASWASLARSFPEFNMQLPLFPRTLQDPWDICFVVNTRSHLTLSHVLLVRRLPRSTVAVVNDVQVIASIVRLFYFVVVCFFPACVPSETLILLTEGSFLNRGSLSASSFPKPTYWRKKNALKPPSHKRKGALK